MYFDYIFNSYGGFMFKKKVLLTILVTLPGVALASLGGPYISLQGGWGGIITNKDDIKFNIDDKFKYGASDEYNKNMHASHDIGGMAGRIALGYLAPTTAPEFVYGAELGYGIYTANKYSYSWHREGKDLDTDINANFKYKAYSVDLLAVLQYNFATDWHLTGKLGAAYVDQKLVGNIYGYLDGSKNDTKIIKIDESNHKLRPEIALGVGYNFTTNFSAGIAANYIFGSKPSTPIIGQKGYDGSSFKINNLSDAKKGAPISTITLDLTYRFL